MKRLRSARVPIAVTRPRRSRAGERRSCEGLLFRLESMFREISCQRVFQRYQVRGRHSRDIAIDRFRRDLAGSGMTAFEMKTVESCSSLAWIQRVFSVPSRSFRSGRCHKRPCSVSRIHAGRPAESQGRTALKIVSRGRCCLTKDERARRPGWRRRGLPLWPATTSRATAALVDRCRDPCRSRLR